MAESFISGDPLPLAFADTHPAWCAGYGCVGGWRSLGASVIGPGHIRRYRARDDAFVLMGAGGYLVAAVADGVGGQMYSRIGAAHCANTVCGEILRRMSVPHVRRFGVDDHDPATLPRQLAAQGIPRETPSLLVPRLTMQTPVDWSGSGTFRWNWQPYRRQFPTDLYEDDDLPPPPPTMLEAVVGAFDATCASLASVAGGLRVKPMALTCTLLVLAVDALSGASVAAQLGDGAILHLETLQHVLPPPDRTEEGDPFTTALEDWRSGFAIGEADKLAGAGWMLLTDGALDFFPGCGDECRALLRQTAGPAQQSLELLAWLQALSKPDCEDDRTVAAIVSD